MAASWYTALLQSSPDFRLLSILADLIAIVAEGGFGRFWPFADERCLTAYEGAADGDFLHSGRSDAS